MSYKYLALTSFTKQEIAKYYGIKVNQLIERHYYCYYSKFFVTRFISNYN